MKLPNNLKLFLALSLCCAFSPARAWDPTKPFIYEMKIAFETDNWINMYSTATVLSKSDNAVAFRVVANSTTNPTYQLVVTTQGNVGISTGAPAYKLDVNGNVNAASYYVNGSLLSTSGPWTTSGSNIYYNSGNVGIGVTASPAALLDMVNDTTYNAIRIRHSNFTQGVDIGFYGMQKLGGGNIHVEGVTGNTSHVLMQTSNQGNVGIGTTSPGYTLTVSGQAWVTSGAWTGSDARWKKNVSTLNDALDKVLKLRGVSFDWRADEFPAMKFPSGGQIGFIAQEVKKVVPEIVTTDNNGYMGVSYERLAPVLTEAIKELKREVDELRAENKAQQSEIEKLKAGQPQLGDMHQ